MIGRGREQPVRSAVAKKQLPKPRIDTSMVRREDDRYFSRAVGKSFDLLGLLNRVGTPLPLNELSRQVGLTKSSTFRLLHTLQTLHYVNRDTEGRYSVAAESWISASVQITNTLVRIAKDPARALNMRFQETINLAVLYANHIEVVQVFESPRIIRMANTLGGIIPPHASSLGKAITAFQPEQVQSKLIHSYGIRHLTAYTITDEAAVFRDLAQTRKQGFAREDEEAFLEGCCLGCPIFAGGENAVAAISTSMPKSRMPQGEAQTKMISDLQSAARALSSELARSLPAY